jgi:glucokinase
MDTNASTMLAIDLGGHNLRTALVDAHGHLTTPTRVRTENCRTPQKVMDQIVDEVQKVIQNHPNHAIGGLGIAVPGFASTEAGVIYASPNFPTWKNVAIKKELEERLPFPVVVANDANAAALGEHWCGKGQGANVFIMLTLGTGVGSGIILDGKVFKGSRGAGAELGHIKIREDGPLCGCGGVGCLETWVSGTALEKEHGQKAKILFQEATMGNPKAIAIFHEMGRRLGTALSNICFVFDPDVVAIGGRVSQAFNFFYPGIDEVFAHNMKHHPALKTSIVQSTCWNDGGLLGVAKLAFDQFSTNQRLV